MTLKRTVSVTMNFIKITRKVKRTPMFRRRTMIIIMTSNKAKNEYNEFEMY